MVGYVLQTEEEYNEIMESEEIKEMKKAHSDFRDSLACELLESIRGLKSSQFKVISMQVKIINKKKST